MALILIIEHNAAITRIAVTLLKQAGHAILEASNAIDGIGIACEQHPDLILIAMQLPDFDGLTVARVLKGDDGARNAKIVALTAFTTNREEIWAAGCDDYLATPICIQDFLTVVKTVLQNG